MPDQIEQDAVMTKTRELCQTILQQPDMVAARLQMDAFLGDSAARAQYQQLITKGQALQQKQESSVTLSDEEIADFESHREQVLGNPVAKAFLDAQEKMQSIRHTVNKLVSMTLETGQVPSEGDVEEASCGHGCNCH